MSRGAHRPGCEADTHALARVPAELWGALADSARQLLMLDYDGTLAALVVERDRAIPCARSLELLMQCAARPECEIAIVSGRPVLELKALLGGVPFVLIGEHGWESAVAERGVQRRPLPGPAAAALTEAFVAARRCLPVDLLERKRTALVLHTRGLPEAEHLALWERARSAWAPHGEKEGPLELHPSHGGLELRARGHDKGSAVRALRACSPAGTLAVYVGDDETDEAAFEAVRETGYGIRVGPPVETAATGALADPVALAVFLAEWARIRSRPDPGA
ncbi:MAG: trehalose-phosphatase [Candidatus Eisenbacteria bacterium]